MGCLCSREEALDELTCHVLIRWLAQGVLCGNKAPIMYVRRSTQALTTSDEPVTGVAEAGIQTMEVAKCRCQGVICGRWENLAQ